MAKKKRTRKVLEDRLDYLWSKLIRTRDGFMCQKCGSLSKKVSAHHAFGRRHRAVRWDIFNGVSLCYACHIHWAHRDPAGFTEWFVEFVGEDQYARLAEAHNDVYKPTIDDLLVEVQSLEQLIVIANEL